MMIHREIEEGLLRLAGEYPVVTVLGPRQSGKTTLVQASFPEHTYCNLENPEVRRLAESDPKFFFEQFPEPVILDEVQRVPELLSWIQVRSDEKGGNGQYILTGSHQLRLHEAITQSLAGRTAILRLLPLSIRELCAASREPESKEDWMLKGFLPRIYDQDQGPSAAYRNYFQTYVERDVRQLIELRNLSQFELFMKLLAGRVGQMVNMASLANDAGVSAPTIKEWLSILEASFVIYRLQPYYRNIGKRLMKSPKFYFVETGLAVWLLGIETREQLARDPLHGGLFENMVVMEAVKARWNQGKEASLYYLRDNVGNEVDLIFEKQRRLIPIEIKSAMTWNADFAKGIRWLQKHRTEVLPGHVIYAGELTPTDEAMSAHSFVDTASIFGN